MNTTEEGIWDSDALWNRIKEFKCFEEEAGRLSTRNKGKTTYGQNEKILGQQKKQ